MSEPAPSPAPAPIAEVIPSGIPAAPPPAPLEIPAEKIGWDDKWLYIGLALIALGALAFFAYKKTAAEIPAK